jgi:PAS domain S-box-containing protein
MAKSTQVRNNGSSRLFTLDRRTRSGRQVEILESSRPEDMLTSALSAFESGKGYRSVLDRIAAPVYATDSDGRVTYWNQACVDFAGREPQLGHDRWCVTWQLYTMNGDRIPHDQCPMAMAIRLGQPIRNEVAIALRPDGTRAAFRPYPTPIFDEDGKLTGAINLLVDISEEQSDALMEQAARCRRLARSTNDERTLEVLRSMAVGYEDTAAALRKD